MEKQIICISEFTGRDNNKLTSYQDQTEKETSV